MFHGSRLIVRRRGGVTDCSKSIILLDGVLLSLLRLLWVLLLMVHLEGEGIVLALLLMLVREQVVGVCV
jgi:hypothetical protein